MATFVYPDSAELMAIAQDFLPRLMGDRPAFKIFPTRNINDSMLIWDQLGNFVGLQAARGMNGEPFRVKKTAQNRYVIQPGVYGEFSYLNEQELTRRAMLGSFATPMDVSDMVLIEQNKLLQRELDRQEFVIWTMLTSGTVSVSLPTGGVTYTDTYSLQTYTASVTWSTLATSTPLADLRAMQLLSRGHSVRFDSSATLYLNQKWVNNMLNNTNANDLGGKRVQYGNSVLTLDMVNTILLGNNLPKIVPMDAGYYDETGTFQLFIADGTGVLVGSRTDGANIGFYGLTRNANNADLGPGSYSKVIDRGETTVPRSIEVHRGHNGGICVEFPSAIVTATL